MNIEGGEIMTIKECYQSFGGAYQDIFNRFRSEERIEKYINKFLQDQSFQTLKLSLETGNIEDAFRSAHTLKGVSQNLGFNRLAESSHLITEALRTEDIIKATSLFLQVSEDYNTVVASIKEYQGSTNRA
ncbi:Hpt domain-containing protein [Clostridioides sp. ES-S-0006-03]|uniref:Hpt domain-containing protein n=1 Tax=Clostridioides sp. ES-S-0006-03 TaxID=2770775 RepID=UPI001D0C2B68|nr:Hpt domain-containing protein [Clostridioides sp. ES-S-0006-03]